LRNDRALIGVIAVALALRLILASRMTVFHADEVWQYLEPAYGLVTGSWVRAWEFHAGIRGWFVPLVLAAPIALGQALAPQTQLHLYLVRGVLALASLAVPIAWYDLARPISRRHALVAGWVGAVWCEVFYFAVRPSAEAIGLTLLFPAMALAQRLRRDPRPRQALLLGLLLAIGFVVRFHYLPAIGLIALWSLGSGWRRTLGWVMLGGLAGLLLGGLADVVTGHPPLVWIWRSITFNVMQGGSELFGTQPPWWFVTFQVRTWGWATLALVPLALIGVRRHPLLLAIALAVIGAHSLIAHKEYRFILLGTTTLVLLAAIGSVDLWDRLARGRHIAERAALPVLAACWAGLSLTCALTPVFFDYWTQGDVPFMSLVLAGEQPGLCGFAMFDQPAHPALAMTMFNRKVPVLLFDGEEAPAEAQAMAGRYNVIEAPQNEAGKLPAGYRLTGCRGSEYLKPEDRLQCLFVRAGDCHGGVGDFAYQPAIERRGK
jgi:hypothetical protein